MWPRQALDRTVPLRRADWEVAYEVDFTALPDSGGDFADGTVSIDGRDWTASNTANSSTFDLDAGTGLRIAPTQSTVFDNTSQTAPYLEVPLQELVGPYERADRLLIVARVASAGLGDDFQSYGLQVGQGNGAGGQRVAMLQYVHDSSLQLRATRYASAGAFAPRDVSMSSESPFIGLLWRAYVSASVRADTDDRIGGHAWPRPRDMTRDTWAFPCSLTTFGTEGNWSPTTDALRLWAERNGSTSGFTATFEALRILVQRWGS